MSIVHRMNMNTLLNTKFKSHVHISPKWNKHKVHLFTKTDPKQTTAWAGPDLFPWELNITVLENLLSGIRVCLHSIKLILKRHERAMFWVCLPLPKNQTWKQSKYIYSDQFSRWQPLRKKCEKCVSQAGNTKSSAAVASSKLRLTQTPASLWKLLWHTKWTESKSFGWYKKRKDCSLELYELSCVKLF